MQLPRLKLEVAQLPVEGPVSACVNSSFAYATLYRTPYFNYSTSGSSSQVLTAVPNHISILDAYARPCYPAEMTTEESEKLLKLAKLDAEQLASRAASLPPSRYKSQFESSLELSLTWLEKAIEQPKET